MSQSVRGKKPEHSPRPVRAITRRQQEVLDFLVSHERMVVDATYRDVMKHFGFRSTEAVICHLRALQRKGFIRLKEAQARGIEIVRTDA